MSLTKEDIAEFTTLLSADLENGDTDKVVSLFQYNKTLYETIPVLLKQGSMFVRLGVNMVMEDLKAIQPKEVEAAIKYIEPLLQNENPTIQGDAVDLIGIIGEKEHIPLIEPLLEGCHPQVQEIATEAIEELQNR